MITPTVGRIVWFYDYHGQREHAAIVTRVFNDHEVNVTVFDNGLVRYCNKCPLVQPGEDLPATAPHCTWMPYQVKKRTGSESGEPAVGEVSI